MLGGVQVTQQVPSSPEVDHLETIVEDSGSSLTLGRTLAGASTFSDPLADIIFARQPQR